MHMKLINLLPGINIVRQLLSDDKNNGVKHAYYVWDYNQNGVLAFDTEAQFQLNVERYKKQDVHFSKLLTVEAATQRSMGVTKATIHVFRDANPNSVLTEFEINGVVQLDYCGVAFGYMPASCEMTVIEIEL